MMVMMPAMTFPITADDIDEVEDETDDGEPGHECSSGDQGGSISNATAAQHENDD